LARGQALLQGQSGDGKSSSISLENIFIKKVGRESKPFIGLLFILYLSSSANPLNSLGFKAKIYKAL
jgi:hypothetical protein